MYSKETLIFQTEGRSHFRIPSVITTNKGTVLAFCNDRRDTVSDNADEVALMLARKRAGEEWSKPQVLLARDGWNFTIGSAVYDDVADRAICFFNRSPITLHEFGNYTEEELEALKRSAAGMARMAGLPSGKFLLCSEDDGESWQEEPMITKESRHPNEEGQEVIVLPNCHGGAHGIRLRHGEHQGRLLCPSRFTTRRYQTMKALQTCGFNNAVYSDDHGKTWATTAPVQVGTGEGTLIERGDGSILYNSRAYFGDGKRYLAVSRDGGATYGEFQTDSFLREEERMGCNASFLRVEREDLGSDAALLLEGADSVTVFVNPRSTTRERLTACISFDSGATWATEKLLWEGKCAYSSLAYSPVNKRFYLLYEKGADTNPYEQGISMLEFDLAWLLAK